MTRIATMLFAALIAAAAFGDGAVTDAEIAAKIVEEAERVSGQAREIREDTDAAMSAARALAAGDLDADLDPRLIVVGSLTAGCGEMRADGACVGSRHIHLLAIGQTLYVVASRDQDIVATPLCGRYIVAFADRLARPRPPDESAIILGYGSWLLDRSSDELGAAEKAARLADAGLPAAQTYKEAHLAAYRIYEESAKLVGTKAFVGVAKTNVKSPKAGDTRSFVHVGVGRSVGNTELAGVLVSSEHAKQMSDSLRRLLTDSGEVRDFSERLVALHREASDAMSKAGPPMKTDDGAALLDGVISEIDSALDEIGRGEFLPCAVSLLKKKLELLAARREMDLE